MSRACAFDMWQQPSSQFGDLCQTDVFDGAPCSISAFTCSSSAWQHKACMIRCFFLSLSYICVIHVSARQPGGSFEGNEPWGAWAPQTPLHTSCELLKCLANGTGLESCYIRLNASCKTRWRKEMVRASLPVCQSEWDARVNVVFTPGGEVAWLRAQILNWSLKSWLKRWHKGKANL